MSALDQAFIKAYAKNGPAPAESVASQVANVRKPATIGSPPASLAGAQSAATAPLIDNLYADGALYRIEVPAHTDNQPVSPPHYAPPASQHRTTQRRVVGRHRQMTAPVVEATPPAAEPAAPARRMPLRGLSEVARRLAHYLPPAPAAELPPEVLIVEEPAASPAAPTAPAPKFAAPSAGPADKKARQTTTAPAALTPAAPVASGPPPSDDVATMVEVCTPWESINDAVSASMVILTDSPFLPASPLSPPVDVAPDPIVARRVSTAGDPAGPPSPDASAVTPLAIGAVVSLTDQPDQSKKTYRLDPPQPPAALAPHFATAGDAASEQRPGNPQPPAEPPALPRAELSAEEMASLIGTPPIEKSSGPSAPLAEPAAPLAPLVPMWEVDRFQWPAICDRLMKDERSYFAQAGGKLVAAARDGLKTLGITGSRRGEGRTTLALCLARCAAHSGLNVAMIDADFTRPQLASVMGLEVAYGWQDAAQGKIPLAEAAVKSLADKITVLPLEPSSVAWPLALADKRVSEIIHAVAQSHDLVIIDLGPLPGGGDPVFASDEQAPLDAAIVLRDLRYASSSETQSIGERLHASGVEAIGIAENFVPAEQAGAA